MKKNRNKNVVKNIFKKYNFHLMQREIESYGYTYSFKNFIITSFVLLFVIVVIAIYMRLQIFYMIILMLSVLLIAPFLIRSQFKQMYEMKRFEMVTTYLDNMLPIFKRNPIIASSWNEVIDLLEDDIKETVIKARNLVINNTENHEVLKKAFSIIEDQFPNSRIHSMHQMMYTVELNNTKSYVTSVDNMWSDIQAWIKRVSVFQKDLKDRKSKLIILSLLTMFCNCIFVSMYTSNEIFASFTENAVYQISSTIFMITLIVVISMFQIKLTGEWLLDDQTMMITEKANKSFTFVKNYKENIKGNKINYTMSIISFILFLYHFFITSEVVVSFLCLYLAYYFYTNKKNIYKRHSYRIKKYLQIEYPSWLREVTLNLQNLTIINAIEASKETSSEIMCYYIDKFLNDFYENPTKIQPFNQFLSEYRIDGVKSSMKVLYSLQTLDKEEMDKQTHYLILRNQEMLEKSESIKNEETIGSLKLMGFLPVAVFVLQMLVSMALLFIVMLNLMNSSVLL